jgi:hypothetical protein
MPGKHSGGELLKTAILGRASILKNILMHFINFKNYRMVQRHRAPV